METPNGETRWPRNEVFWTAKTTFDGLTVKPTKSGQNLRDVIEMLVEIFTIDDRVVKIIIDELEFHVVENHIKKADENLCTRSYPERDAAILIPIPVRAEGSEKFLCFREGYLIVGLIEIESGEKPCLGKPMKGRLNIRQGDGLGLDTLKKQVVIYHSFLTTYPAWVPKTWDSNTGRWRARSHRPPGVV
jgi:hypothetical protein